MSSARDNYENAEYAKQQHEKLLEQEREQTQEQVSHSVTRAELERRREKRQQQQTYSIRVEGLPVEMRPPPAKVQVKALRLESDGRLDELDDVDVDETAADDVDFEAATDMTDLYIGSLAEYSVEPPGLDYEFWSEYDIMKLKDFFVDWIEGAPEEDNVSGFREE